MNKRFLIFALLSTLSGLFASDDSGKDDGFSHSLPVRPSARKKVLASWGAREDKTVKDPKVKEPDVDGHIFLEAKPKK